MPLLSVANTPTQKESIYAIKWQIINVSMFGEFSFRLGLFGDAKNAKLWNLTLATHKSNSIRFFVVLCTMQNCLISFTRIGTKDLVFAVHAKGVNNFTFCSNGFIPFYKLIYLVRQIDTHVVFAKGHRSYRLLAITKFAFVWFNFDGDFLSERESVTNLFFSASDSFWMVMVHFT